MINKKRHVNIIFTYQKKNNDKNPFILKKVVSLQTEINKNMAEVLIKYDARNSIAKKTLEFFLSLGIFEIEKETEEKKRIYSSEFVEKIKRLFFFEVL